MCLRLNIVSDVCEHESNDTRQCSASVVHKHGLQGKKSVGYVML